MSSLPFWGTLVKVPDGFVVVELDIVGAAILGQDAHDACLLFGGEHNLTMMRPIVLTIATTKECTYSPACFGLIVLFNVLIKLTESPGFLHAFLLMIVWTSTLLPGCGIDGMAVSTLTQLLQHGLMVHAGELFATLTIKTQGIPVGYITSSQFLIFHIHITSFHDLCHFDGYYIVICDMGTLLVTETQSLDGFAQSHLVADGVGQRGVALLDFRYQLLAVHLLG